VNQIYIDILHENIKALNKSADWVRWSYERTQGIDKKDDYSADEFAQFEVLTSRFARTADMLVNKVLRSIDIVEMEDTGTVIDIMNRAEKRGITSSAEILHTIKDLRNNIAHEYKIDDITRFFADVQKYTPALLDIIQKVNGYCAKYLNE
jgi:uncharacterized protein YutE (UPF0331/DUF86 family)